MESTQPPARTEIERAADSLARALAESVPNEQEGEGQWLDVAERTLRAARGEPVALTVE